MHILLVLGTYGRPGGLWPQTCFWFLVILAILFGS